MSNQAQRGNVEPQPYNARADKSGFFIGGMVCIVIVVPMLIHLGKMVFGVSS
ncbi:MAG: hypothetical protein ACJAZO_002155 [Myxococcota bacterium]|jgi:hypothetical protein